MSELSLREQFLQLILQQRGKRYVWGAKGPDTFDCSGLITWALRQLGQPDWRITHNCQRLREVLKPTTQPLPGDVILYGTASRASHAMVLMPDGRSYGARGSEVNYRPTANYRGDMLGYWSLPL